MAKINTQDLIGVITEGTMRAAVMMIRETSKYPHCKALLAAGEYEEIVAALRTVAKDKTPRFIDEECRAAVECRLPEPMLREMINLHCNVTAKEALEALELKEVA
jgi:hypothetical protein